MIPLILAASVAISPLLHATPQVTQEWVQHYAGNANGDDVVLDMVTDSAGNVIVTGYSYNANANSDFYTAKYAANGVLLWAKHYDGPGHGEDYAYALAVDGAGNVIVAGTSNGATFAQYPQDYYTVKYAAVDGAVLWDRRYDGEANGFDDVWAVTVDNTGNVIVTGESYNGLDSDYYTAKYATADGSLVWEVLYDSEVYGVNYDVAKAVAVDGAGNVIVTGVSHNGFHPDIYTAKYAAADGSLLWEMFHDSFDAGFGTDFAYTSSVAVDSAGNVIISGYSSDGFTDDYYTAKYRATDGDLLWEKRYDGSGGGDDYPNEMVIDGMDNVIVTGGSTGEYNLYEYATVKYAAADGAVLWEKRFDNPDILGDDVAFDVAVDAANDVIVLGTSNDDLTASFALVKYAASDGALLWVHPYSDPDSWGVYGYLLALNSAGNVLVAGDTHNGINDDWLTVKFSQAVPVVAIGAATNLTSTGATLHGNLNPQGWATTAQFEYGPTTAYGSNQTITLTPNNGTEIQAVSAAIGDLISDNTYHCRIKATNPVGTTFSNDQIFTTSNSPPTISDVTDKSTNENTGTAVIPFTIGDVETAAASLTVTRNSSNLTLIPLVNVVLGGSGANRNVTITPAAGQSGTTTITLTVSDGTLTASDSFMLTVIDGLTIASWRQLHFLTPDNTGDAADLADPDKDGLKNVIEYAFGLNPNSGASMQLPQPQRSGENFVISFTEPAGIIGITYGAEWSPAMEDASWLSVPDTGSGGVHTFSVPIGTHSGMFMRLKVTNP